MKQERVKDLCRTLAMRKDWPRNNKAIETLWKSIQEDLKKTEQVNLLNCLVQKDYVFKWLRLISYILPDLASEKQSFINLLENIVEKVKGDMAQGDFIRSLIKIGQKDPAKGISLYSRINKVASDLMIQYSGLILGGAAKKSFEQSFKIIDEGLKDKRIPVKAACLKALRVAFEDGNEGKFEDRILDLLEEASKIQSILIQREIIHGYIDFDKLRPEICEQKLLEIATTGNASARFTIIDRLWFDSLQDQSKEVEILRICSEDTDVNVLNGVARVIARKGQAFLNESLEMVRRWLKRSIYSSITNLDYYLCELGKNRLNDCLTIIGQWIDSDEDAAFRFRATMILSDIASSNFDETLKIFENWIEEREDYFKEIVVKSIIDILLSNPSDDIIDRSFSMMKDLREKEIQPVVESGFFQLFGSRPPFTRTEKIIEIINEWAYDSDWRVRKMITPALSVLSEYKIDSEETMHLLVNKKTRQTKVAGISTRKIKFDEGVRAYELLKELTKDENEEVRTLAKKALDRVNIRLQEKEKRIDEQIKE